MIMDDISTYEHHPALEELSEFLCVRTERDAPSFFRVLAVYYLGLMASCMRAKLVSPVYGEIPVNNYVCALAPSGFGKGKSTGAMENDILTDFRTTFRDYVLLNQAEKNMNALASRFAALRGTSEPTEYDKLVKEFTSCGEYPFVFDGGSEAAIKQVRQMLLMANCGSLNLQIDEIGTNLEKVGTMEAMATYLELYDLGMIKNKLKMNTADNKRIKELEGKTPANMLLFGTPTKLLDGGPIERKFTSMLETGYARRCLFAFAEVSPSTVTTTDIDEIYTRATNPANNIAVDKWRQHFAALADPSKINWEISVPEDVDKTIIAYKLDCQRRASELSEFDEIRRAEIEHRYFRVMKVAGTLAFVDEVLQLSDMHVKAAIKLVEESGKGFQSLLNREPPHAKLARYIASTETQVTHAELFNALPFYKAASKSDRSDLLTMATAWGYRNHIILRKNFVDGVELLSGDALKETSLDAVNLSFSHDYAYHYEHGALPFERLPDLTQDHDLNWCVHGFMDKHRCEEKTIPGFNLIAFDVDGGTPMQLVHELLADYVFMTHTTKRHTEDDHRFRLIMPMNYQLKLDGADYREFMRNIMGWLPFSVDESTIDPCRKWATNGNGTYHMNLEGQLFDVLPFVPKTMKNEQRRKEVQELGSLDNLERWFAQRIADGNRNNQMIKFALALVDSGMDYNEVEQKVLSFNSKLNNGLAVDELQRTVLVTAAKRLQSVAA
jgi:hypothetical protein